jgi:hypothetical protein
MLGALNCLKNFDYTICVGKSVRRRIILDEVWRAMKGIGILLGLALLLVTGETISGQDVKPDLREKLETAIPEGIRMLEAKEHVAFIKAFVPPEMLKKILGNGSIEEFAAKFAENKAETLLQVLTDIKGTQPELDKTGTKATFKFSKEISGKKEIKFSKVEKFWCIDN